MKRVSLLVAGLALASVGFSQTYQSDSVRFMSQIPLGDFPGAPTSGAGCYGYVSSSGREYVTMGLRNGTSIVDITNPIAPRRSAFRSDRRSGFSNC